MSHRVFIPRYACLVSLVAFISAAPAFTQVAYVYVQTNQGAAVALYDTVSSGRLTEVGTYPLYATSTLIGGNGSYLFAGGVDNAGTNSGETNVDSYPVESNGALGARTETIDTEDYAGSGSGCSGASIQSAKLDHTGHYMFVRIYNSEYGTCDQWQTYQIASNGVLTYLGREESPLIGYLETVGARNEFSYGTSEGAGCNTNPTGPRFFPYSRNSDHVLSYDHNFTHTDPAGTPLTAYTLWASADPFGSLAVLMGDCANTSGLPAKIASYTIDPKSGSISSSNTWSDLPTTQVNTELPANSLPPMFTSMSWSGNLLAVVGGGFQIFDFNGQCCNAAPYIGLQRGTDIIHQAAWDNDNHFYTLDFYGGQLRVYTVTLDSFSEDPGSPVDANGGGFVVVNHTACSAPSGFGVNVCSPGSGATVTSPVLVNAAANVNGSIYRFELWNGNTKLLSEDSDIMDDSVSLAPGSYQLIFDARSASGAHEYATRDITVTK
ncbi:MAG TPA: hypothetical protein VHX20_07690 [Terracidiphilus sp.]|nr:hypothetical protein [Terracidiphilus sp.]